MAGGRGGNRSLRGTPAGSCGRVCLDCGEQLRLVGCGLRAAPAASYAWFPAVGPGATTYAWTACSGAFGSPASFAIAKARVGGASAAFAAGWADPWAGIETGTDMSNFSDSSTFQGDSTGTGTEFANPYTLSSTGITLDSNATDSELNSVDNLAAYLYTGSEDMTTLCGLFGGTDCSSSQSTQTGDITDLGTLASELGPHISGKLERPGRLGRGSPGLQPDRDRYDTDHPRWPRRCGIDAGAGLDRTAGCRTCVLGWMRRRRKA